MPQIAVALVRRRSEILLVRQQGPTDPEPVWALPGGVVQHGELVIEALAREVHEETGLKVIDSGRLAYVVQTQTISPHLDGNAQSTAFVFDVTAIAGRLR